MSSSRSVTILFGMMLSAAACSGGARDSRPTGDPARAVTLDEWCHSMMHTACDRMGKCMGSSDVASGCLDSGVEQCLAGRGGGQPAGHTGKELDACLEIAGGTACDGYMMTLASHTECQATAAAPETSTSATPEQ